MADLRRKRYIVREDGHRFLVVDQNTGDVASSWWSYDRALNEADAMNGVAPIRIEEEGDPHHG
jgi:hypothetical protein